MTIAAIKPRRRWFRFSLRTLFAVVTVLGCWLGYQLNWIRQRHAYLGSPFPPVHDPFDDDVDFNGWGPPPAPWSLRLFGERGVRVLTCPCEYRYEDYQRVHKLFPEAKRFEAVPCDSL